jgi:hypothetical protein
LALPLRWGMVLSQMCVASILSAWVWVLVPARWAWVLARWGMGLSQLCVTTSVLSAWVWVLARWAWVLARLGVGLSQMFLWPLTTRGAVFAR